MSEFLPEPDFVKAFREAMQNEVSTSTDHSKTVVYSIMGLVIVLAPMMIFAGTDKAEDIIETVFDRVADHFDSVKEEDRARSEPKEQPMSGTKH